MLLTDLLLKDSTPVTRRFFNALAEEPETVAAVLVPQASRRPVIQCCTCVGGPLLFCSGPCSRALCPAG